MTKYENEIVIFTQNEIQTRDNKSLHGYKVGQIAFDSISEEFYELKTKNPHYWRVINSPLLMKKGRCEFVGSTLRGEGMMNDFTNLGATLSGNAIDGTGTAQTSSTGTASIRNAGFGIIPTISSDSLGLTRTNFLPYYMIKFVVPGRTSGDQRLYSGWIKNSVGPTVGETPISNTEGGIIVGYNAADTTWNIWHSNGDGSTAVSKDALPNIAPPTGFVQYRIEMIFTSTTTIIVNVYSSTHTLLDTLTVSTNTLPFGKSINWVTATQNPTQVSKTLTGYGAIMRALL